MFGLKSQMAQSVFKTVIAKSTKILLIVLHILNKMSKYSLNTHSNLPGIWGSSLRAFIVINLGKLKDYFISYKDTLLNRLKEISIQTSAFFPDYTIESLKKIEKWYFDLYEKTII